MVRLWLACAALVFGLLGLIVPAVEIDYLSWNQKQMGGYPNFSALPPGVPQFIAPPSSPYYKPVELPGLRLWNYLPSLVVVAGLALGFLAFCIAWSDRFFKSAAVTVAVVFAGTAIWVGLSELRIADRWSSAFPLRMGFAFLLLTAIAASIAAWRDEELPGVDELLVRRGPMEIKSSGGNAVATPRAGAKGATAPRWGATIGAAITLIGACIWPVVSHSYAVAYDAVPSLLGYAPAIAVLLSLCLVAVIVALVVERADLRKLAAGVGAVLTFGWLLLLWRDAHDEIYDYTYGIFSVSSHNGFQTLGLGFWLMSMLGLCWFALCLDNLNMGVPAPQTETARKTQSAPQTPTAPRRKTPKAPLDTGALALHIIASLITFGFCSSVFPLGIFLWRYFDEQSNPLAGAAFWGWVLGLFYWIGLFLLIGIRTVIG